MEFCGGGSVYELLNQACGRSLPEGCIAYICREVLQGLIYLHKNGIAHRDIKAANIALTEDAEVRIIDFGLAVELKWYQSSTQLAGTPNYTAPEVWTGARYKFEVRLQLSNCPLCLRSQNRWNTLN
ncbi:hypothetical protein XENTR_v10004931 [Xenopus tropicalis]|nr:hypothetical protein XENTR_v10004931 [Xenopus tropicalis]